MQDQFWGQGTAVGAMDLGAIGHRGRVVIARDALTEGARRAINVAVATIGLVLAAPLMLVIALLIKLTSRGPVFYTQIRVGVDRRWPGHAHTGGRRREDLGGRPFRMIKFRTMRVNVADMQVWATEDDPRITFLGRLLRKTRLDELPQLWNVLSGDMNIVGPRPEQPAIFAELREQIEAYDLRQAVLPGITGWAQINHRYDGSLEDVRRKVALDLEYLARRSALEDLKIMLRTIPVMLLQRGAL